MAKSHLPFILHSSPKTSVMLNMSLLTLDFPLDTLAHESQTTRIDNRLSPPGARTELKKKEQKPKVFYRSTAASVGTGTWMHYITE